jgi:molybdopterin-guanine dinucleotide biosynthesis protein A
MRGTHLLSLAIDMPFMTEKYLRSLCQQVTPDRGVLPMIGGRAEPLAAIYPVASHVAFLGALSGVEFSLQKIVRELVEIGQLRVLHVTKEQELLFRNLNKPADVRSELSQ